MTTRAMSTFEITSWREEPYDERRDAPVLSRVTVDKVFRGEVEATGVAVLLTCHAGGGGDGYVASERVTGRVHGRSGTFVLQHGGVRGLDVAPVRFGLVVPGSGTGGLRGLRGTAEFREDERGATFTLDYEIVDETVDQT